MAGTAGIFFILFISCFVGLIAANQTNPIQPVHTQVKQYTYQDAILKCIILDKTVTSIRWTKNGQHVKGDERHAIFKSFNSTTGSTSLKIKSLKLSDFGEYVCQASFANTTFSAAVKLVEKKSSTIRPAEKVVKKGLNSTATLSCLLPKEATSISWLRNGVVVKTGKRHQVLRSSTDKYRGTRLIIEPVEKADYGSYECAANVSGKRLSAVIKLTDMKGLPPVEASPAEVNADLGSNVILRCDLAKTPSSVTWSKNGIRLKSDERRTIVKYADKNQKITSTTLNFKKLVADDFGTYQCEAVASGINYSAVVKLADKKDPPPVETSHAEVKEALGSNVILKCNLAKNPSSVTWTKNGTELNSDEHRTIVKYSDKEKNLTSTTLHFKNLAADDFGTYQCEVDVSGKKYSASIQLAEKK